MNREEETMLSDEHLQLLDLRENAERAVRELRDEMEAFEEGSPEYEDLEQEMYYAENEEIYWQHMCESEGL
jgi:hypothetical protein